jgi:hypothetical protein
LKINSKIKEIWYFFLCFRGVKSANFVRSTEPGTVFQCKKYFLWCLWPQNLQVDAIFLAVSKNCPSNFDFFLFFKFFTLKTKTISFKTKINLDKNLSLREKSRKDNFSQSTFFSSISYFPLNAFFLSNPNFSSFSLIFLQFSLLHTFQRTRIQQTLKKRETLILLERDYTYSIIFSE